MRVAASIVCFSRMQCDDHCDPQSQILRKSSNLSGGIGQNDIFVGVHFIHSVFSFVVIVFSEWVLQHRLFVSLEFSAMIAAILRARFFGSQVIFSRELVKINRRTVD